MHWCYVNYWIINYIQLESPRPFEWCSECMIVHVWIHFICKNISITHIHYIFVHPSTFLYSAVSSPKECSSECVTFQILADPFITTQIRLIWETFSFAAVTARSGVSYEDVTHGVIRHCDMSLPTRPNITCTTLRWPTTTEVKQHTKTKQKQLTQPPIHVESRSILFGVHIEARHTPLNGCIRVKPKNMQKHQ